MKYVGATNWYIRVPYIVEGALVGLAGALLAWGLTSLAYDRIVDLLMAGAQPTDFLTLISKQEISHLVLLINALMGIGIGATGSAVSVRKHVKV